MSYSLLDSWLFIIESPFLPLWVLHRYPISDLSPSNPTNNGSHSVHFGFPSTGITTSMLINTSMPHQTFRFWARIHGVFLETSSETLEETHVSLRSRLLRRTIIDAGDLNSAKFSILLKLNYYRDVIFSPNRRSAYLHNHIWLYSWKIIALDHYISIWPHSVFLPLSYHFNLFPQNR